jgi:hypothetical protein
LLLADWLPEVQPQLPTFTLLAAPLAPVAAVWLPLCCGAVAETAVLELVPEVAVPLGCVVAVCVDVGVVVVVLGFTVLVL